MSKLYNDIALESENNDSDYTLEELYQYGFTTEALPVVAIASAVGVIALVIGLFKLITKLCKSKGEACDDAAEQILNKSIQFEKLTGNMVAKLRNGDPRKILEDENHWTIRDKAIFDGKINESMVQDCVKELDKAMVDFVKLYEELDKEVVAKTIAELEKIAKGGLVEKIKETTESGKENAGDKEKITNVADSTFKSSGKAEVIFKKHNAASADYGKAVRLLKNIGNVKMPENPKVDTIKRAIEFITDYLTNFKTAMKDISAEATVTIGEIEKAKGMSIPEPSSVLKVGTLNNLLKKIKIEDDLKKLESLEKEIESRFSKLKDDEKKKYIQGIKEGVAEIKAVAQLTAKNIDLLTTSYIAYCGFYNRLLFTAIAVHAYHNANSDGKSTINLKEVKEKVVVEQ